MLLTGLGRGEANPNVADRARRRYHRLVTAIQKRIVLDESGQPLEVVIPWTQYCEMSEALGLDLDADAMADLREARHDWENRDRTAFVPLSEL